MATNQPDVNIVHAKMFCDMEDDMIRSIARQRRGRSGREAYDICRASATETISINEPSAAEHRYARANKWNAVSAGLSKDYAI